MFGGRSRTPCKFHVIMASPAHCFCKVRGCTQIPFNESRPFTYRPAPYCLNGFLISSRIAARDNKELFCFCTIFFYKFTSVEVRSYGSLDVGEHAMEELGVQWHHVGYLSTDFQCKHCPLNRLLMKGDGVHWNARETFLKKPRMNYWVLVTLQDLLGSLSKSVHGSSAHKWSWTIAISTKSDTS